MADDQSNPSMCYWQVLSKQDFYVQIAMAIVSLLMFMVITTKTIALFRYEKHTTINIDKKVKIIFISLCLWGLFHFLKIIFSLYLFYFEIINFVSSQQQMNTEFMNKISSIFCSLDSISTVLLQGILIIVPYTWTHNILLFLLKSQQISQFPVKTCMLLKAIRLYSFGRYIIYICLLVGCIVEYAIYSIAQILCLILNIYIMGQAFLCILVLGFGLHMLLSNFQALRLNENRDKNKLFRQFVVLMSICIVRFIFNFIFLIAENFIDQPNNPSKMPCKIFKLNYQHTIVYLAAGIILTHYLPVLLVLKFYNIDTSLPRRKHKTISYSQIESNPASVASLMMSMSMKE